MKTELKIYKFLRIFGLRSITCKFGEEEVDELIGLLKGKEIADKWSCVFYDLDNYLRETIKHNDNQDKANYFQEVRDKLYVLVNEENLDIH
jgi:hypothetical protein